MPYYDKYGSKAPEGIIIGHDSGGWLDVQSMIESKGKTLIIKSNNVKLPEKIDFPGMRY